MSTENKMSATSSSPNDEMIEIPDIDFENVCLSDGGGGGRGREEIKPDDQVIEIPGIECGNGRLSGRGGGCGGRPIIKKK